MSRRFVGWARSQWLALLALFVALATGSAYAANTVFSTDIVDGQVKTVDIAGGAVTVEKIAGGSITGDKIKDGAILGRDVLDNTLQGADIDESTLSGLGGGGGLEPGDLAADEVVDGLGPLPRETTFTSNGGTLVITASGSGFRGTGTSLKEGMIGMRVLINGSLATFADVYTNERNSHKAFFGTSVLHNVPAGTHTISLGEVYVSSCNTGSETQGSYCTDTDSNDVFQVTVLEIPN